MAGLARYLFFGATYLISVANISKADVLVDPFVVRSIITTVATGPIEISGTNTETNKFFTQLQWPGYTKIQVDLGPTGGQGWYQIDAWCTDLFHNVNGFAGSNFGHYDLSQPNSYKEQPGLSSTQTDYLRSLILYGNGIVPDEFTSSSGVSDDIKNIAASVQIAIWTIEYGTKDGGQYNLLFDYKNLRILGPIVENILNKTREGTLFSNTIPNHTPNIQIIRDIYSKNANTDPSGLVQVQSFGTDWGNKFGSGYRDIPEPTSIHIFLIGFLIIILFSINSKKLMLVA
jgi:hypothetical protein